MHTYIHASCTHTYAYMYGCKKKRNGDTIVTVVGIAIAVVMELVNSRSGGSDSSTKSVYKLLHKRHV